MGACEFLVEVIGFCYVGHIPKSEKRCFNLISSEWLIKGGRTEQSNLAYIPTNHSFHRVGHVVGGLYQVVSLLGESYLYDFGMWSWTADSFVINCPFFKENNVMVMIHKQLDGHDHQISLFSDLCDMINKQLDVYVFTCLSWHDQAHLLVNPNHPINCYLH